MSCTNSDIFFITAKKRIQPELSPICFRERSKLLVQRRQSSRLCLSSTPEEQGWSLSKNLLSCIFKLGHGREMLQLAIDTDQLDVLNALLHAEPGHRLHLLRNGDGDTALMRACRRGSLAVVNSLLSLGDDTNEVLQA